MICIMWIFSLDLRPLDDNSSSSTSVEDLLEPSATMNDLPSEVMKNIFSFVGKGN